MQERKVKPPRADDVTRWLMATLSRMFQWRDALLAVKPDTLIRWHRKRFRLFWRWKSKSTGRPRLPKDLRELIRKMAAENPTWGEERIANELELKLGIRNYAKAMVACDFFVVVTASFRILYVFAIMELGTWRILHHKVTA